MANQKSNSNDGNVNLDLMLLEIMRQKYPDIPAYQEGKLLYVPPQIQDDPPQAAPETTLVDDTYQIDTSMISDNEQIKRKQLISIEPFGDPGNPELQELINQSFSFFLADPGPELDIEDDIEDDVFISVIDFQTNDPHDLYLTSASGTAFVYFIQNGNPRRITNYKTLEVMLVQRNLTYEDIRVASDSDHERYQFSQSSLQSMRNLTNEWGLQIRFQSGYKPIAPFVRDPGDYYNPNGSNDFGTPYNSTVYLTQTSKEALRAKYEGKLATYDMFYEATEVFENGASNPGFGKVRGTDVGNIRLMTMGYWKFLDDTRVLALYNEINEFGANIPGTREQAIVNLFEVGGVTNFEGSYTTPQNEQTGTGGNKIVKSNIIGWNDFPHISGANVLDLTEYKQYLDATNNGKPFDLEYMQPYEPAGSIKYYAAGTTLALANEAQESLEDLDDQVQAQYSLNALYEETVEDITQLATLVYSEIGNDSETQAAIEQSGLMIGSKIQELQRDIIKIFDVNLDTSTAVNLTDKYRLEQDSTGTIIVDDPNVFQLARLQTPALMKQKDRAFAEYLATAQYHIAPRSAYTIFGHATFANAWRDANPNSNGTYLGLFEYLMHDTRLHSAISQYKPGKWGSTNSNDFHGDSEWAATAEEFGINFAPSNLDQALADIEQLTTEMSTLPEGRGYALETLSDKIQSLLDHAEEQNRHRYASQVQDLIDGSIGDNAAMGLQSLNELQAEADELIGNYVILPSVYAVLYHMERAFVLQAYATIAAYAEWWNSNTNFTFLWSNLAINLITNYIPEWNNAISRARFFGDGFADSDVRREVDEKTRLAAEAIRLEFERSNSSNFNSYSVDGGQPDPLAVNGTETFGNLSTFTHGWIDQFLDGGGAISDGSDAGISYEGDLGQFQGSNDPDVYGYS